MYVLLSEDVFSYEIQALVKAFFPKEKITIGTDEITGETEKIWIFLEESNITVSFIKSDNVLVKRTSELVREPKREFKNILKRTLYEVLAEVTGDVLPWGALTGVRPTKLAMELVESGISKEEARERMQKWYLCSEDKARLGVDIVEKELSLLKDIDYKESYSLYVGIPFCPTTCLYCSFTSYSLKLFSSYVEQYLDALFREIQYAGACLNGKKLATIYIGGGTPTTLTAFQLERLIGKIKETFDMSFVKEFTVEAGRPDSISQDKLMVLKKTGVTRISINPQTMNQTTLDVIGRCHTVEQVKDTFFLAREIGFRNINMDLIVGLPNETVEDVMHTFDEIKKLNPDSITVHSLVLKRAAILNMKRERYEEFHFGDVEKMIALGHKYAKENEMEPYYLYRQKNTTGSSNSSRENIGYAKNGKEGLYNILIMEEKHTILALGAGAACKFVFPDGSRIERIENVKSVKDYVERIDEMIERKRAFIEGEYNVCC
ncbi:coproporphyrinogen dehydrogenase HemZ [Anaeromicropila populeti]|uniref:Oxygen-independent coproporphyrinogen-3 oxidase n=1 Tax=Anaeromicropila populeti TaxID=37658 RepID=A0A1I6IRC7_9FIRM|nr:coproporphyrinogen dehydrogenase HemZ [Anaeromicropila populeti]SFR69288.1 oxygen-independent coproporphyrinogen-3 oxidase [Anaeromicropila populeti]